jgi:hypothetical protein
VDPQPRVILCGPNKPSKRDLEIVAEFAEFLRNRKDEEVPTPQKNTGSDAGAPDLNDLVENLDSEDYCDPIAEEDPNE